MKLTLNSALRNNLHDIDIQSVVILLDVIPHLTNTE